jgi:hypothetical protein
MVSSGMLRRVALVRTNVSEEPGASLVFLRNVRRLLVAACVVPSSPILVILMKEAPGSFETSILTRVTRRNIPKDTILHSHRRENLKSYIETTLAVTNSVLRFLVTANVVPSSPSIPLMMAALYASEKSVLTRATRHSILQDGIPHSHRREKLKSYK